MNRPKKPTYKLTIGKAPHTSADMRFTCGRIVIKVSDKWPDAAKVLSGLFDIDWQKACKKALAFWKDNPLSLADYNAGIRVELTEPGDWSLAAEVERMDNAKAARAAKSGEGAEK